MQPAVAMKIFCTHNGGRPSFGGQTLLRRASASIDAIKIQSLYHKINFKQLLPLKSKSLIALIISLRSRHAVSYTLPSGFQKFY